jgi:hypothetical protein
VRYLEILLAALIFVTSLVLGTAIPRVDWIGAVEETPSEIAAVTSSLSVPSTAGEDSIEVEALAPPPNAIARALSPASDSLALQ